MTPPFRRLAGWSAVGVGLAGFLYSAAFVARLPDGLAWSLLVIGGILTVPVTAALFVYFRTEDNGFALTGAFFGFGGALGAIAHGGYGLAVAIHPAGGPNLPNE